MPSKNSYDPTHISSEELLLTLDSELPARRLAEVREHLALCGSCRQRMDALTTASTELHEAYRQSLDPYLPSATSGRAALREKLAHASPGRQLLAALAASFEPATAALVLAAAIFGVAELYARVWLPRSGHAILRVEAAPMPKPALTPGAVIEVPDNICLINPKEDAEVIPASEAKEVFHEYGVDYRRAGDYELDYLITPALGGTTDIHNLWPEPHSNTEWNSYVKDQLEDRLHDMVCSGQVDLQTAQRDIATNWIAAYKRYFHTDMPLPRSTAESDRAAPPKG